MDTSFISAFSDEIGRICKDISLSVGEAFAFWVAQNILNLTNSDAREAISVEGPNDKGIDIFWVDDEDEKIIVAQCKYSSNFKYRGKDKTVSNLRGSLAWLRDTETLKKEGRIELVQASNDYNEAVDEGYGIELWYIYAGEKNVNVEKICELYNRDVDNINNGITYRHYHYDLIKATWDEICGISQRVKHEVIDIASEAIYFEGDFGSAIITNVPGSEVARLYDEYGDLLFAGNVRLFLPSRKGSVNAGIARTLSDQDSRKYFWAFNNGITFICDKVNVVNSKIDIVNFSIVNGCQTTVSISNSREEAKDIDVLTRFIAASPRIVEDIIRYNNSQNQIKAWDIASRDSTQRRIKKELDSLRRPYYYQIRRGEKPGEWKRYKARSGRKRKIKIDSMGQFAAAFRGYPVLAHKNKALIFELDKEKDKVFPPDVSSLDVLFQWVCSEICTEVVDAKKADIKGDEDKKEDLFIIKKGGILFVLATMAQVLELRNGKVYLTDLSEENVDSTQTRKKLKKYADYSCDIYVEAVNDQVQLEGEELATLIRQREFYKKVRGRVERDFKKQSKSITWLNEALPYMFQK